MIRLLIAPIEECWRNSRLSLSSMMDGPAIQFSEKPLWMTILICILALYILLTFDRLLIAIQTSWSLLFRHDRIKEYLDNNNRIISQNISIVMILPMLALILFLNEISSHSYIYILIALSSLVVFKLFSVQIIKWITDNSKKIEEVIPIFCSNLILTTLFLLPLSIARIFLPISQLVFIICAISIASILFLSSLFRSRQRIINSRFSHIFCFLYLCALEIIPIALSIRLIIV